MTLHAEFGAQEADGNGRHGYLVGIDVGGTFTDVVVVNPAGRSAVYKAFSVRNDEAQGILDALEKAAVGEGVALGTLLAKTERLVHGSTIAANALLEKAGARLAFVTTAGFRDTLVMRRMFRPNMYDLHAEVPETILPREAIVEVPERVDRSGAVAEALTDDAIASTVAEVGAIGPEAVGISLLFSFRNADHEQRLRDALRAAFPDVYVAASSDIIPEIRDYERASTTALSAYLGPKVAAYLRALESRLRSAGLRCPVQAMRSNGGVCSIDEAISRPTDMLLSGPAGGVVGAISSERVSGEPNLISFDMGGTSCDISVVREGKPTSSTFLPRHSRFEGWDVLTPFLDIQALGSGGGSVAWLDKANGLHVGPRSAGSSPGPACYGLGGTEPTVTDADLWLGYLNPDYFLGEEMRLDIDAAERALDTLGGRLDMTATQVAAGIYEIVNSAMAGRINIVLAEKGCDAAEFTLLCFGGAGAVHAPAVTADLGIRRTTVPRDAAAFSAAGLLRSNEQYDFVRTVLRGLSSVDGAGVESAFREMQAAAADRPAPAPRDPEQWRFQYQAEMRYSGQTHDVRVSLPDARATLGDIQERYEEEYAASYGYLNDPALIQLVNLRLLAVYPTLKPNEERQPRGSGDASGALKGRRDAYFIEVGGSVSTPVYDGTAMRPGHTCTGPAVIELPATTIVVRPHQQASVDEFLNFVIDTVEVA